MKLFNDVWRIAPEVPLNNSGKLQISDVPRLVRGIQRSSPRARFLDPEDKPRDVGVSFSRTY